MKARRQWGSVDGRKKKWLPILLMTLVMCLSGCALFGGERMKLRDLEFTVLSEEMVPAELAKILEEKRKEPFQMTYTDMENLYLCVGYGAQPSGGFSIAVEELYLTDATVVVKTLLLGPDLSEKQRQIQTYPYIVIKTEALEEPVIFE